MLRGRVHHPIALAGSGLQFGAIQNFQLPPGDFDQAFLAQFASGQCDRFAPNAQRVGNFLVGYLKGVPLCPLMATQIPPLMATSNSPT